MKQWLWHIVRDIGAVGLGILMVAAPTILLLMHAWYEYRIVRLGYDISRETERHEQLVDEHRELTIEATLLQREEHHQSSVRELYGLTRIEPRQVVTIDAPPPPEQSAPDIEDDGSHE